MGNSPKKRSTKENHKKEKNRKENWNQNKRNFLRFPGWITFIPIIHASFGFLKLLFSWQLCCETNRNRPYVFLFIRQLIVGLLREIPCRNSTENRSATATPLKWFLFCCWCFLQFIPLYRILHSFPFILSFPSPLTPLSYQLINREEFKSRFFHFSAMCARFLREITQRRRWLKLNRFDYRATAAAAAYSVCLCAFVCRV